MVIVKVPNVYSLDHFDMAVNYNNHSGKPSPSLLFNMYPLVVAHIKTIVKFPLLEHHHFRTAHNTPSLPHKTCTTIISKFHIGITKVPREIEAMLMQTFGANKL